ncbi:MAG: hypothetical protein CSA65_01450 [Proteobacteria bacterium]|nr:MAG: hypothetical protein CSB49_03120 [Pseudomonadota bacterium]PIE19677.1 MAG: hypothetical protein CSA65_01450 [Pseudomonadota bacterium]
MKSTGKRPKSDKPEAPEPPREEPAAPEALPLDPRPLWLQGVMIVAPAALGVPLALSTRYVPQLLGMALVLIALYGLLPLLCRGIGDLEQPWVFRGREVRWLPGALPAIGLVIVTCALLWPTFLGQMVQSQDHTIHLSRAWHFVTQMLGKGQLSGWSDWWFAGYPAGEDYPPAGDWLIGGIYLGTFGLLGWEATYAVAVLAMYAIAALGVYAFGRVYLGRFAGFLGGLFFLLDRGQYREGGWNYTIWWGVWPQVLSTGFTFLSFALLDRVIKRARPRDFALAGLATGAALVAHPVAVIYFGLGAPIFLVARALSDDDGRPAGQIVARCLAALAIGGALAAFWVLPFVAKGSWMAKYGELWKSLPEMGSGLWEGKLFDNAMPPVIILGAFGAAVALWRRSFGATFLAAYGAVTLFLASSTAFQGLDLLTISPSFGQIQFQRLSILAKPCVWLLAGYAISMLFQRVSASPTTTRRASGFTWPRYVLVALVLLVVAPFVRPVLEHYGRTYGRELGRPKTRKQVAHWKSYQRFLSWSKGIREKELKQGFYRIAYVRPYNDHFFGAALAYNQTPMYKVGYTPAINFKHKPDTADPRLYKLLNVKYVVSIGGQGGDLELVKRFGAIYVYRFKGYTTQRYTLKGPGSVKVERFEPGGGGIRLKVSGATDKSRLILHVANYPNWGAKVEGGDALPISTGALGGHKIFISVPAKNGTLVFSYGMPAANLLGALLSWLAIGLLLLFAIRKRKPQLLAAQLARLAPLGKKAERWGVALGVFALLVPVAGMALKGKKKTTAVQGRALIDALDRARVELDRGGAKTSCKRRGARHQCSKSSWNHVGPSSQRVGDALRRCIWAHPVDRGLVRVTFPGQTLGSAIMGHHGLTDSAVRSFTGGAAVTLKLLIDGKVVLTRKRPNTRAWASWRYDTRRMRGKKADIGFEISTTHAGGRHYCFDAVVAK